MVGEHVYFTQSTPLLLLLWPSPSPDQSHQGDDRPLGIPVTVSDMVFGFTKDGGPQPILQAIDQINIHELSFFLVRAVFMTMIFRIGWLMDGAQLFVQPRTTGGNAWPLVQSDTN